MLASSTVRLRFFVLTCREARADWTLHLASALQDRNLETYYIWLRRKPVVAGPTAADTPRMMSFLRFLIFLMSFSSDDAVNIYFNSTCTSFPWISLMLRLVAAPGVWCFDVYDDFRYGCRGLRGLKNAIAIKVLELGSDLLVHAAPNLSELFPNSHHLGNASHIRPVLRNGIDFGKILLIASLDGRFDFGLMDATARCCTDIEFHIYGQVSHDDSIVKGRLERLCAQCGNVRYHGSFTTNELPGILERYTVAFAPYRAHSALTRYIDPLRYYHCLNSGMELITTEIPQAVYLNDSLHIIKSADEFAEVLVKLDGDPTSRRNVAQRYHLQTWEMRIERLLEILCELPRTKRLAKRTNSARSTAQAS